MGGSGAGRIRHLGNSLGNETWFWTSAAVFRNLGPYRRTKRQQGDYGSHSYEEQIPAHLHHPFWIHEEHVSQYFSLATRLYVTPSHSLSTAFCSLRSRWGQLPNGMMGLYTFKTVLAQADRRLRC